MSKTAKRWAIGAGLAAVAGYVAGILTAPKSGKDTRHDIKEATEHGVAEAEKQLKKLHTQMGELLSEAKTKAAQLKGTAQKDLQIAIERTTAVKEKVRQMLSALHEDGGAEDADLKKAINDATKTLEDLQKFLKK